MYRLTIISVLINLLMNSNAVYLGEKANYKSRMERNNILNKGLWMKDKIEKSNYGDFIFRAYSGDVDNLLQNNFDAFGENYMDTIPIFSSYVERNKRSTINKQSQRLKKRIRKCNNKMNCSKKDDDKGSLVKSKFISQLRPTSVFNDYPYGVAVLLANSNKREINNNETFKAEINDINNTDKTYAAKHLIESKLNAPNNTEQNYSILLNKNITIPHNKTGLIIPKRRMTQSEFDLEEKEKVALESNKTKYIDGHKINRNVFDKEERLWQNSPIQNMVLTRPESSVRNKPITEKGLVKILSLLTKTFRKVMKQHNEIQEIDNKLHSLNEEFMKNIATLDTKFQDFETKYRHLIEMNEQMQHLNEKFIKKTDDIKHREIEMTKNLKEFENQQQKFLSQQHQFYTIQKFMLDQNEKINRKQSLIAKTQSEISQRQNNFARVLKKAKQFYTDKKNLAGSKLSSLVNKPKNSSTVNGKTNNITFTSTTIPLSTDSVKINLFSIPNVGPVLNHDKLILEEKNDQPVDELVYKYYFNNTFIDNLMKSKVLTAIVDNEAKTTRNAKNKRQESTNETTILLPVGNIHEYPNIQNLHRERRWIGHHVKLRKSLKDSKKIINRSNKDNDDPYLTTAIKFCTEVGQNQHKQMFKWCVEKSLRKLKSIDMIPMKPLAPPPVDNTSEKNLPHRAVKFDSESETTKLYPLITQTAEPIYTTNLPVISTPISFKYSLESALITERVPDLFFPDNDELESNLKRYELKPDTEGTVYFDGSLHTSDIVISESDALSDVMPGLDSNSHVDVDPLALDFQARRRAYVRRLNENILKATSY